MGIADATLDTSNLTCESNAFELISSQSDFHNLISQCELQWMGSFPATIQIVSVRELGHCFA
jgi:hypothetical protein